MRARRSILFFQVGNPSKIHAENAGMRSGSSCVAFPRLFLPTQPPSRAAQRVRRGALSFPPAPHEKGRSN